MQILTFEIVYFSVQGTQYLSTVYCLDSICTPVITAIENACQYICGFDTCEEEVFYAYD